MNFKTNNNRGAYISTRHGRLQEQGNEEKPQEQEEEVQEQQEEVEVVYPYIQSNYDDRVPFMYIVVFGALAVGSAFLIVILLSICRSVCYSSDSEDDDEDIEAQNADFEEDFYEYFSILFNGEWKVLCFHEIKQKKIFLDIGVSEFVVF